jgi:photosystem II stability/assembly factor-like uncharacterized protein
MRKSIFLILSMSIGLISFSQPWKNKLDKNKPKEKLNFFDYKKAFDDYWAPFKVVTGYFFENGVKKKATGWKQFKRWEHDMEGQVNLSSGAFPEKSALEVYKEYRSINPLSKSANSADWKCLGPFNSEAGEHGVGRINCIAFHPSDMNTYWVGAASGGLWVTTNNGSSWTCLTDNQGVLGISDIVIPTDYETTHTIYIATGDRDGWHNNSIGVLKSTDGGSTWLNTGIDFSLSNIAMVNRLLLDPGNNQTIIAATSNGVYKTSNGGIVWSTQLTTYDFIDLEYKPGDFNTIYASTRDGKIYVTSDGGGLWTQIFSDASACRIELAVSANQPAWVYAVAVNAANGLYGIYKSTNSGATYSQVFSGTTSNLLAWSGYGNETGGQGWYDLSLAVSHSDANTLLVGGVNTWRSTDGGTSWSIVNYFVNYFVVQTVHADKHSLTFRSNGDLFECNDGGVFISTNNGTSWTNKTNGMAISQIYRLGVSNAASTEVITGLQDNGTKTLSGGMWSETTLADGMECIIDNTNVNIQYRSEPDGYLVKTSNHWVSSQGFSTYAAGQGAWVTPYIINPNDPLTLYAGYADIWKTTNRGDSWTKISSFNSSYKIRSMAIAASNVQVIYVSDIYNIWKTTDGGTSWNNITGTLPVGSAEITYIAIKNDDPNTLWITISGYNANKVFQSIDGGTSWTNISAGLPQIPAYTIVQNIQSNNEVQLYVGTELGVYLKKGYDNWVEYNTGLPNVRVGEIEIYYDSNPHESKLRAATFGRGLWETPFDYSGEPMTYISSTVTQNNTANVFPNNLNREIIGIQITTVGSQTPLIATSFTLNTLGTTNPLSDISNAKLFYTGASSTFTTTTQFGLEANSPDGVFTIPGTQTLCDGINYFWLTYDISATAILNNYVDAQCTSLIVGTTRTPLITNPTGNRLINYCSASSTTCASYIQNVTIGKINNTSECSSGGYSDYSSMSADITKGSSLNITVTSNRWQYDYCGIWIDWNNNGDFLDDPTVIVYTSPGYSPYYATINCPPNASPGLKRMRVRIHNNSSTTSPCDNYTWGEVEDYSINVTQNVKVQLTVFLEAPFDTYFGAMKKTLLSQNLIPLSQPYNIIPWTYTGTETVTSIPSDIIDWVLVELRQTSAPANATSSTIFAKRAAFLKSNGAIVDLDGTSPLKFENVEVSPGNDLYPVIRHRNHLAIMSSNALPKNEGSGIYTYDFSTGFDKVYGGSNGYKQIAGSSPVTFGMVSGESDPDGQIFISDYNNWASQFGNTKLYKNADLDMDGDTFISDYNKWATNFGISSNGNLKSAPLRKTYVSCVPK